MTSSPGESAYVQADVDPWLAHALAAHLGHSRDRTAHEEAAGLLAPPVLAHAALLAELARLVPGADMDQLAFAGPARRHRARSRRRARRVPHPRRRTPGVSDGR